MKIEYYDIHEKRRCGDVIDIKSTYAKIKREGRKRPELVPQSRLFEPLKTIEARLVAEEAQER